MNCDDVRELAGAYALDALSSEERVELETHVESCDLHDDIASLRAAALGLAAIAPDREPSADLGARIIAAATSGEAAAPSVRLPDPASDEERAAPRWRPWLRRNALAAGLAVLVLALLTWNLTLQFGDDAGVEPAFVHVYRGGDDLWLRVETTFGEPHATVALGGLSRLSSERTYQLWAIRDERWLSIGTFNTNPEGKWQGDFAFTLRSGDTLAVTIEDAGGSERPTAEPVMSTRL